MPIENKLYLLRNAKTYEVEPEILAWAKLHAYFYLDRYKKDKTPHWKEKEKRKTYIGLVGQKIFDCICLQLDIPKDHNDPILDWRKQKPYDFKIPKLGTVEVKCFDYYCEKVLVKLAEHHGNDYLVVFRFADEPPTKVILKGWLTRDQVESLPISRKGEKYTPHEDAYICDFEDLNRASEFLRLLVKAHDTMFE